MINKEFSSAAVEGVLIRSLIDTLIELKIIHFRFERKSPIRIVSGDKAMMAFKLHGVLNNAIKQRKCTR